MLHTRWPFSCSLYGNIIDQLCNDFSLVDKHLNSTARNGTPIQDFETGSFGDWKKISLGEMFRAI